MTHCDLCLKKLEPWKSTPLQEQWRTEDVNEVCKDCADVITEASMKLDAHLASVKASIRERFVPNLYAKLRRRREEPTDG